MGGEAEDKDQKYNDASDPWNKLKDPNRVELYGVKTVCN